MSQFITITSQGQITIPAAIRRLFGLDVNRTLTIEVVDNKITLEPTTNILDLKGVIADRAIKDKSLKEVVELEEKAAAKSAVEKYRIS